MKLKNNRLFIVLVLFLTALCIYLFVSAPAPLPEEHAAKGDFSVNDVFLIVSEENDVVRKLYTSEIVGAGKKAGLAFAENWREETVAAGPLPALFLRETSASLSKSPVPLELFLGSDFPISAANSFSGRQTEKFLQIKQDGKPQFFFEEDTKLHTAMFPDYAVAPACVQCHNGHADSPKKDWELGDPMGATTWSYPRGKLSMEEMVKIITTVRNSFRQAYSDYLSKAKGFPRTPEIGTHWPRDGYYLPDEKTFFTEFSKRASPATIKRLMRISTGKNTAE